MEGKMNAEIKRLLTERGPCELSVLYHELSPEDHPTLIHCAYEMKERGEVWWITVNEEYAIVGLPEQPRPEDPWGYLGLMPITDERGTIAAPRNLIEKYGLPTAQATQTLE